MDAASAGVIGEDADCPMGVGACVRVFEMRWMNEKQKKKTLAVGPPHLKQDRELAHLVHLLRAQRR